MLSAVGWMPSKASRSSWARAARRPPWPRRSLRRRPPVSERLSQLSFRACTSATRLPMLTSTASSTSRYSIDSSVRETRVVEVVVVSGRAVSGGGRVVVANRVVEVEVIGARVVGMSAGGSSEHDAPTAITTAKASALTVPRRKKRFRAGAGEPGGLGAMFRGWGADFMPAKILGLPARPKAFDSPHLLTGHMEGG